MTIIEKSPCGLLTAERSIDQKTGESHSLYYYKDKLLPQLVLNNLLTTKGERLAKNIAGLSMIKEDLKNALGWMNQIDKLIVPEQFSKDLNYIESIEEEAYKIAKGLFLAALVFYAKCFTSSNERYAELNQTMISDELIITHKEYMSYRDKYAAHSHFHTYEQANLTLLLDPNRVDGFTPQVVINHHQLNFIFPKLGEVGLKDLILHAIATVTERQKVATEKLINEEINAKGLDYWYYLASNTSPNL